MKRPIKSASSAILAISAKSTNCPIQYRRARYNSARANIGELGRAELYAVITPPAKSPTLIDLANLITGYVWQWQRDDAGRYSLSPFSGGLKFYEWWKRRGKIWFKSKSVAVTSMLRAWMEWQGYDGGVVS